MLAENKKAPAFNLPDENGTKHALKDQKGKWVLVYFYPKDNTPGCTKEACMIRDIYNEFERIGITVFGVSKDSPASHKRFKEKFNLPFTLLSDESGEMIEKYGAFKEKSMFGKTFLGIVRMSYLIDPEGRIRKVYPKVDPAKHPYEVLEDAASLVAQ